MIDLTDLRVQFASTAEPAVDIPRWQVNPGEVVLLTGRSGCGKSTLLRVLNGLIPHVIPADVDGWVRVAGLDPHDHGLETIGLQVGSVFQNPRTQYFATDVLSEIGLALTNSGVPAVAARARVEQVTAEVGVGHLLDGSMQALSGGERQRVAVAAALAPSPGLLLLDEPTSNLDALGIDLLRSALQRVRDSGMTVVVAEHRLHYLRGVVDRVVELVEGRIVADSPASLWWESLSQAQRRSRGLRSLDPPIAPDSAPIPIAGDGLVIEDATFRHTRNGRDVWRIPSLTFPRGQVSCVTGPNGTGKTTLARVLCGLSRPRTGRLLLDGTPLSARQRRRRVGVVTQDVHRQLVANTCVDELLISGVLPDRDAALACLEAHGLREQAAAHPASLSGGQKQRLAVATALADRRDVVVFDEPSSGLDLIGMQHVADTARALAERGVAVIVITHDIELARVVGGRTVPLEALTGQRDIANEGAP